MNTCIYRINKDLAEDDYNKLYKAGEVIRNGGLVAFPTETVYGLGGNALNSEASKLIYAAKGRPSDNPLIVHISDISELAPIVKEIPEDAKKLADRFWPGPLTMIFNKNEIVPDSTTGGLSTVAVRMPSHPVAMAFIKAAGCPIAAPSANVSGRPSPTTAEHVIGDLDGRIEIVLDGGPVDIGLESTIVDVTGDTPMILRPGYINQEMLNEVVGKVDRDPTLDGIAPAGTRPKAPGMMYRHYAPKGDLAIVEGDIDKVVSKINSFAHSYKEDEVGIITTEENADRYPYGQVVCVGRRDDEDTIARLLYAALRTMDEKNVKYIYVESFSGGRLGDAIMNRLIKAAGHKFISAE